MYLKRRVSRSGLVMAAVSLTLAMCDPFPARAEEIPLRYDVHPYVSVRLDGLERDLAFIVDSAAGATVVDREIARQHAPERFESLQAVHVSGASSTSSQGVLDIKGIHLGQRVLGTTAVVTDMKAFWRDGFEPAGILGNDLLRRFDVRFDVAKGRLQLVEPASQPLWFENGDCQRNRNGHLPSDNRASLEGFLFVDLMVPSIRAPHSPVSVRAVVDTGAAQTILNWSAAKAIGIDSQTPGLLVRAKGTVGLGAGNTKTHELTLPQLAFNAQSVKDVRVRISDLPVFKVLGLEHQPAAIFGIDVLKQWPFAMSASAERFCVLPVESEG